MSELEVCPKCGSSSFGIVRDMTSRRECQCGASWPCPEPRIKILPKWIPDQKCKNLMAWIDGLEIGEVEQLKINYESKIFESNKIDELKDQLKAKDAEIERLKAVYNNLDKEHQKFRSNIGIDERIYNDRIDRIAALEETLALILVQRENFDDEAAANIYELATEALEKKSIESQSRIPLSEVRKLVESLEYYSNHESVIKEAYHSNDEKQITCVHTFINHKANEALQDFYAKFPEVKGT